MKRRLPSNEGLLRVACVLALLALPLMVWSVFDPRAWPVLLALSLGQALGTFSFALFLVAVARDLGIKRKVGNASGEASDPKTGEPTRSS